MPPYDGPDRRDNSFCQHQEKRCRAEMKRIENDHVHDMDEVKEKVDSILHPTDGALAIIQNCAKKKIGKAMFTWIIGIVFTVLLLSFGFTWQVSSSNEREHDEVDAKIHALDKGQVTEAELDKKLEPIQKDLEEIDNKLDRIENAIK